MDRKEFLKRTLELGLAAGATTLLGRFGKLLAQDSPLSLTNAAGPLAYDMAAVKGALPDRMFREAIGVFGGMGRFVKKNSTVVVKPNIGWAVEPEGGANTNPLLVGEIIKQCLEAGAKKVYVFDHTCDNGPVSYRKSGIEKAVIDAGGQMAPGNSPGYYQKVTVPGGAQLKSALVHELILESDVFINAPVLKDHGSARVTIGMKNLMGIVWDRSYWHANDLHQCIADFAAYRKPDLTVVDAYRVMLRNGPRGYSPEDVNEMKNLVVSLDPVAADAAGAKLFGMDPEKIRYIRIAGEKKLGNVDLSSLNIRRIVL